MESRIEDRDLNIEDINKIFLEVNPLDDKSFIYGWELGRCTFCSSHFVFSGIPLTPFRREAKGGVG
ncbi:hypothetical protein OROGR_032943 [Orobanche gracilis]